MEACVHQAPPHASRWRLASLREALRWLSDHSVKCVWTTLKRLGIRYKRGREYVHSPDPDYPLKLAYIQAAQQQARTQPQQVVLLYQDELTYYRRPSVDRAYALCASKDPKADQGYSTNKKRRISGSLNWLTGQFHAQQLHRFGLSQLKRYYLDLQDAYPQAKTIYLVQDNWPVHRHPDLVSWLAQTRLVVLWLPTYAPWCNPVEKVWLRLKQDLLHLHSFRDDWAGLQAAVQTWLDRWSAPSHALLQLVGLSPY